MAAPMPREEPVTRARRLVRPKCCSVFIGIILQFYAVAVGGRTSV